MGIPADFQQTHSSLCLHIWLLLVRLRAEGKDGKQLAQVRACKAEGTRSGGAWAMWRHGQGAGQLFSAKCVPRLSVLGPPLSP